MEELFEFLSTSFKNEKFQKLLKDNRKNFNLVAPINKNNPYRKLKVFVIYKDNILLSVIIYKIISGVYTIQVMEVNKNYKGSGYGHVMMQIFENVFKPQVIELYCYEDDRVINFWKNNCFKYIGHYKYRKEVIYENDYKVI